jgi:hypothetical protein
VQEEEEEETVDEEKKRQRNDDRLPRIQIIAQSQYDYARI